MARPRSLGDMVADVRQRTNLENSEFPTDDEIAEYLNQELAELHGRLTLNEGHPHFRSSEDIDVEAGTALYGLPDDFWKLQRLTATFDGITRDLEPFMENERARLLNAQIVPFHWVYDRGGGPMYRLRGSNIEILPATRSYTATLYYVLASPRLIDPSETVEGFNGYEVAAIYGVCATLREKEETDPTFYMQQKERIYRLIDAHTANRDASHPERVMDVVGLEPFFPE